MKKLFKLAFIAVFGIVFFILGERGYDWHYRWAHKSGIMQIKNKS